MKIDIDDEIKELAINHSLERMNFEYDRFKLNDIQRRAMIIIGIIGELAFKKYLTNQNIDFNFEFQAGKYDNLDFEINNDILEIKSSGFEDNYYHLNLLYSNSQLQRGLRKNFKYCVVIFINGYDKLKKNINLIKCNQAIIYGYIEFNEIKKYKQLRKFYGDDYRVPLNKLKKINELIFKYKNEQGYGNKG